MNPSRVTQRDIARKAGVHTATVSMALRDHPRIPESTRQRIFKIARELGYAPDPMLSALAAYRDRKRPVTYHGTLAWLAASTKNFNWRESAHYTRYFAGAQAGAKRHGYNVEVFDLSHQSVSLQRLISIFKARNITGVFVCPHPTGYEGIRFPWDEFSLITFGYSVSKPEMHLVASAHYRNTRRAMHEIASRGYHRPGLVLGGSQAATTDYKTPAAYMVTQCMLTHGPNIPPYITDLKNVSAFKRWIKKHRIDVLLVLHHLLPLIREASLGIPEEIGFVDLTLPAPDSHISGVIEHDEKIGSVAAWSAPRKLIHML